VSARRQPVLGILGGGQLARMLALAAAPLGAKTLVVDSAADACAGQVAPLVVADWTDYDALEHFAREVDVVTFDFENVPADTAHWLTEHTRVSPNPRALALAQDRADLPGLVGKDIVIVQLCHERIDCLHAHRAVDSNRGRRLGRGGTGAERGEQQQTRYDDPFLFHLFPLAVCRK